MVIHSYDTQTYNGYEYIVTTFHVATRKTIHMILIYHSHSIILEMFLEILHEFIQKSPTFYPFGVISMLICFISISWFKSSFKLYANA
jgi:hypothetical protein